MVQDLCLYLEKLGVGISGFGTTTLVVTGSPVLDADVDYTISEDPVEAMSLLTAGIVTGSELTVRRAPIDFLEIELAVLAEMGSTTSSHRSTWPPTGTPGWPTSR